MKELSKIYKDAKMCSKKHSLSNRIRCLRIKLIDEIGDDRDLLLAYKIESSKYMDYSALSCAISVFAALIAIVTYIEISIGLVVLALFIYCCILVIAWIIAVNKYKTIFWVLEEIEKEMDKEVEKKTEETAEKEIKRKKRKKKR